MKKDKKNKKNKNEKLKKAIIDAIRDASNHQDKVVGLKEVATCDDVVTECTEEERDQVKELIFSMVEYGCNVEIYDHSITISTDDITSIKNQQTFKTLNPYNENNIVRINIDRNTWGIQRSYNNSFRVMYKDEKMYDEVKEQIQDLHKKIQEQKFRMIYDGIIQDSGLIRDKNLDELLK